VIAGARHAKAGRHEAALTAWSELRQRHPAWFVLVAADYAACAKAAARSGEALAVLGALQAEHPSQDVMTAIDGLEGDAARARARHAEHLVVQPTLGAAAAVLRDRASDDATDRALLAVVERAALPQARYRCAACGFEAQRHFWQCPGCQGWDTFPPQRLDEQ
jgi:lipopolysaccharide biosynthesis regulator YciM